jgi:hypothetical protein
MHFDYTLDLADWVAYYAHLQTRTLLRFYRKPWVRVAFVLLLLLVVSGCLVAGSLFLDWFVSATASPRPADWERVVIVWLRIFALAAFNVASLVTVGILAVRRARRGRLWPDEPAARKWGTWVAGRLVKKWLKTGAIKTAWRYQLSLDAAGFTELASLDAGPDSGPLYRYETVAKWKMVETIEATDRLALIGLGWWGCLLVPRTAFATEDLFQAFLAAAKRWHAAAQVETAITAGPPALPLERSSGREAQGDRLREENIQRDSGHA